MIDGEQDKGTAKDPPLTGHADQNERLLYRVEVWNEEGGSVERVLARALNTTLASAIFNAAQTEYPERRLTVRRGSRIILDSGTR